MSKETEDKQFGLHFGALADPFSVQIKAQGFRYEEGTIKAFEAQNDAALVLRFANLIPDSTYYKIQQKLFKQIRSHVAKKNKLKTVAP